MMIRMAKKSYVSGYECVQNHPEEERRRGKPLLQGSWKRFGLNWFWDGDFTKVLDLSLIHI